MDIRRGFVLVTFAPAMSISVRSDLSLVAPSRPTVPCRLRGQSSLSVQVKILRWVTEAVFELKYMHEKHVIHRDSFSPRRKPRVGQQRHAQSDHPRPSRD